MSEYNKTREIDNEKKTHTLNKPNENGRTHTNVCSHKIKNGKKWMITVRFYDNELTVDDDAAAAAALLHRMTKNNERVSENFRINKKMY